jgi:hypothetical protein
VHVGLVDMFKVRQYILLCQRFYNPYLWVLVCVFPVKLQADIPYVMLLFWWAF